MRAQLIKVREYLSDASHWTKGVFARDAKGNVCNERSEKATCCCLWGALLRFQLDYNGYAMLQYLEKNIIPGGCVVDFNDNPNTTHAQILEVLDKAIEGAA